MYSITNVVDTQLFTLFLRCLRKARLGGGSGSALRKFWCGWGVDSLHIAGSRQRQLGHGIGCVLDMKPLCSRQYFVVALAPALGCATCASAMPEVAL
jgi:hypothetical protein